MMPRNDDPRIDRLVTGDLAPVERRALIQELESDPQGWRDLATAFLEDQCWRESFAQVPRANHGGQTWIRRGVAASLLALAFGLGWTSHETQPVAVAESSTPTPAVEEPIVVREPIFDRDDLPAPRPQPLTEYDLRRLQRMGYQVGLRHRLVAIPGEGGQTVAVPVREVEVRYVGGPPT